MRLLLLLSLIGSSLSAQEIATQEPLSTDRPDQTETAVLVPKGMFQMENGILYEKDGDSEAWLLPTSLMKYGVTENFELRLIAEFSQLKNVGEKSGFAPILIGFKARLTEEKGILPKISVIAHLSVPNLASKEFQTDFYAPEFRFTLQHTVSDKISIGYNVGAEWDGLTPEPTFIYTLTSGLGITKKLNTYIEIFGFAPQESMASHSLDGGFTYLLSDNLMIDISAGAGLTANAPDYYLATGFSFRI